jgi:hypothetical protein
MGCVSTYTAGPVDVPLNKEILTLIAEEATTTLLASRMMDW